MLATDAAPDLAKKTIFVIPNEEIKDIMKRVKPLEESKRTKLLKNKLVDFLICCQVP